MQFWLLRVQLYHNCTQMCVITCTKRKTSLHYSKKMAKNSGSQNVHNREVPLYFAAVRISPLLDLTTISSD